MTQLTVLSLGGSIIAPDKVDYTFLREFREAIMTYLAADPERKLIIVTGGGAPARIYQEAYRNIVDAPSTSEKVFSDVCSDPLVTEPTADIAFSGRILVAAGWKPGFSTDNDAVVLAERFGAQKVINLSNIKKVYSADPKLDPTAVPLDTIDWKSFRQMVGDEWTPGKNVPFDPIAAKRAAELELKVVTAEGRNIPNTVAILEGKPFEGTMIG